MLHPSFCRRSSCVGFAHSDHGCLFLWFYTRSGFIRGLHFGTSPFFTHAHTGGAMRDFTSERSEVKSRPSQHQRLGPRASRPTWGAWEVARADTPYRGRPAPRAARVQRAPGRGGEGVGPCRIRTRPARPSRVRAISLRNAPRRQRASPRGRGGSMVDIAPNRRSRRCATFPDTTERDVLHGRP